MSLVLGAPVSPPQLQGGAAMVNLLDDKLPPTMPEAPLRMLVQTYGKGIRKGRKLGHLTVIGDDPNAVRQYAEQLIKALH